MLVIKLLRLKKMFSFMMVFVCTILSTELNHPLHVYLGFSNCSLGYFGSGEKLLGMGVQTPRGERVKLPLPKWEAMTFSQNFLGS